MTAPTARPTLTTMLFRALALAFAQLSDRRILAVFAKSMLMTLMICAALGTTLALGFQWALDHWIDPGTLDGDLRTLANVAGALIGVLLAVAGFRAVAIPVMGLFADAVVAAVEAQHYPREAERAIPAPVLLSLRLGLMSFLRVLLVNLAALPFYLFLLVTGIGPLLLFLAVNAVLLGRDLAEMVAVRHLEPASRTLWLRNHRIDYGLLGLAITALFLVPIANLAAPIIGAAAATHMFHRRNS